MTNQTIDGVPRKLLTAILCKLAEFNNRALVAELRALLDAHTNPYGFCHSHTQHDTGSAYCPDCGDAWKKWYAAQPQGEPVACFEKFARERCPGVYFGKDASGEYMAADAKLVLDFWNAGRQAEQPPPVAVVLPERITSDHSEMKVPEYSGDLGSMVERINRHHFADGRINTSDPSPQLRKAIDSGLSQGRVANADNTSSGDGSVRWTTLYEYQSEQVYQLSSAYVNPPQWTDQDEESYDAHVGKDRWVTRILYKNY